MKHPVPYLLILLAFLAFATAGELNRSLVRMRAAYRLNAGEPLEDAPPLVTFTTVVLGGFRGTLADILWLRASQLQDQGRYFEIVQLADWITKLEPRFAEVWSYHAWNMAFNVSVLMTDPVDRWRWVRNGIELLRDRGLFYNPGNAELYWNLAWIFQFKLGGRSDRAATYYKARWAGDMQALLGGARPDYAALSEQTRNTLKQVYRMEPEIMQAVETTYGPLDWRLPHTHAVYWAFRGKQLARDFDAIQCDRMIYNSMAASVATGLLTFDPQSGRFTQQPQPALLPGAMYAYESALERYPSDGIRSGYSNFLADVTVRFHQIGRDDVATNAFQRLHATFPSAETAKGFTRFVKQPRTRVRRP
jgi:tetratricopeptide (TPR) repeat protein